MFSSRPARAALLAGAAAILASCQSYEPRPPDLAAHRQAWLARMPGDEPVRAFAERLASPGSPSAFDPSDGLSLAEAEIVALVFNPDLRLARLRAGVAAATAAHAGLWEDPVFSIDVLRVTESVPDPWILSPGLALTIPISGRLEAERQRADAVLAAALTSVAEEEWRTRMDVRRAWMRCSAARLRVERTEALLASIESLVSSTERLAETGEMARTEAALFAIERASQRQALVRFRGEAAEAEQRIRALMGLSPEAPLQLTPALTPAFDPAEPTAAELAERSLTLARLRDQYQVAEKTLQREVREQYPDLTLGPLYESDQGQSRIGFLGAIPIPILDANTRAIAEARAERELAQAAFETAYERLVGSLAAARARLEALRTQREIIESDIVPLVDRQLTDARRLLQLGEGGGGGGGGAGGLVLLESLTRVGQTQMALIEARLGEALAIVDLAELIGPAEPHAQPSPTTVDRTADPNAADSADGSDREVIP